MTSLASSIKRVSIEEFRSQQLERCGLSFINSIPKKLSDYTWNSNGSFSPLISNHHHSINCNKHLHPTTTTTSTKSNLASIPHDPNLLKYLAAPLHQTLFDANFDLSRMREYRLNRIRSEMRVENVDFSLFFEPTNLRYVTDVPNMQVWTKTNRYRYALVSCDERDPVILFDFKGTVHLSNDIPYIKNKLGHSPIFFSCGTTSDQVAKEFCQDIMETIKTEFSDTYKEILATRCININSGINNYNNNGKLRVSVDNPPLVSVKHLSEMFDVFDGWQIAEHAREIKNSDEIAAIRVANDISSIASQRMKDFMIKRNNDSDTLSDECNYTENDVFSIMAETNIEFGGEFLECKLMSSGERSNPWYNECSNHIVKKNTILSYDTDLIGPFGYCADFSRAFFTGNYDILNSNSKGKLRVFI